MPLYEITAPDGKVYEIEGPAGASQRDLVLATQRHIREQQTADIERRRAALMNRPPEAPETTFGGNVKEFFKGVVPGAIGLAETAGTGIAALLPDETEKSARDKIKEIAGIAKKPFEAAPGYEDSVARKLSEGIGSTLPFFALGPLGLAGRAAGAGLGVAAGAGEARQAAEAKGVTGEERRLATQLGAPTGLLDILAPQIKPFKSLMGTAVARGGVEGATEAAQKIAQNLIAKGVYDPSQEILVGSGEEGAYGAGVGALASLIIDMTIGRKARRAQLGLDKEQAPASAPAGEERKQEGLLALPRPTFTSDEIAAAREQDKQTSDPLASFDEFSQKLARRGKEAALAETFAQEPEKGQLGFPGMERADGTVEVPGRGRVISAPVMEEQVDEAAPVVDERQGELPLVGGRTQEQQIIEMIADEKNQKEIDRVKQAADARKATEDKASETERLKFESDLAEMDDKINRKEQKTSEDRRLQVLLPMISNPDIKNVGAAFQAELKRQRYANTTLTEREQELVKRSEDFKAAEPVAPEVEPSAPAQNQAMEALIPEKKTGRVQEQPSFPGMGKPKGPAPQAFSDEELEGQAASFGTVLTPEILDRTGLPKQSGFYKQLLNKDMADPAQQPLVADVLVRVRSNPNLSPATKQAVEGVAMQAFGGLAKQGEMFGPRGKVLAPVSKEKTNAAPRKPTTPDANAGKATGTSNANNKPSEQPKKPVRPASDTTGTKAPTGTGVASGERPAGRAPDGKDVGKPPLKPESKPESKINPRMAKRIDDVEDAQDAAEFAESLETARTRTREQYDRQVKSVWPIIERAKKTLRDATYPNSLEAGAVDFHIRQLESVAGQYDALMAGEDFNSTLRRFEDVMKDLPADVQRLQDAVTALNAVTQPPKSKPKATTTPAPKTTTAPKAEKKRTSDGEKAEKKTETKPEGKPVIKGVVKDSAMYDALASEDKDKAIDFLAADMYNAMYPQKNATKVLNEINSQLVAGEIVDPKFGKEGDHVPGMGGKHAKAYFDSLSDADRKALIDRLQYYFITSEVKTAARIAEMNAQQDLARGIQQQMDDELDLVKDATALTRPLHPAIIAMAKSGNLVGALRMIANQNFGRASMVAGRLSDFIGGTKIQFVGGLKNASGQPVAGRYDPKTDTIRINSDMVVDLHTFLHEITHAATSHVLDNKSHPLTKQLTELYNNVKGSLDTAYGAQSLDEFVAEAFSNPAFQSKLSAINPKGEPISAWQRFKTSIGNFIRRLMGMETKSPDSALNATDALINQILSPAPESRSGDMLYAAAMQGKGAKVLDGLSESYHKLPYINEEWKGRIHEFFTGSAPNAIKNIVRSALPLNALVDSAQKYIPMAGKLDVLVGERAGSENARSQAIEPIIDRVEKWAKTNSGKVDALNNVIYTSTIEQVDPSKPRSEYAKNPAQNAEKLKAWDAMQADWNSLGESGQSVYKQMRDTYKKMYDQVKDVLDARIDSVIEDKGTANKVKAEVYQRLFASGSIEPYFPLTRSGKYWLSYSAVDPRYGNKEFYVEAYETSYARDQAIKELKADPKAKAEDIQKFANANQINYRKAPATSFVNGVLRTLEANKVDAEVTEEVMRLFLNTLPETSFAQSFRRRKGTLGFQHDAIGALRMKTFSLSRQLSNMEYGQKFEKLRTEIKDYVRSQGNDEQAVQMMDELDARIDYAISPNVPQWSKLATSFGFNMTLGFNVSSAIVNLAQIPLVVMPYLGGKYGYGVTSVAIGRATRIFTNSGFNREVEMLVPTDKGEKKVKVRAFPSMDNYDFSQHPELKHLETLVKVASARGQLNRSQIYDILDVGEENNLLTKVNAASGFVFHHGERMNRQVALIAAYELELNQMRKDGRKIDAKAEQEAADYAVYVTELTNGGTAAAAAPRIAQGPLGKVLFMYKRYGVSMYYMLFKTARDALKNEDEKVRKAAMKQIAGIYASAALIAGASGVPMFGVAAMVYNIFKGDDDDDMDTAARKWMGELYYSGLGNAVFGVEIANRVGLSDLLFRDTTTKPSDSVMLSLMEQAGGPVLGVASRMERGLKLINEGYTERGIEQMLPSAMGNMLKAMRFGTEGANTLRGDPITGDLGYWNTFAQFFGFAPAEYTRQLEINSSIKNIERKTMEDRTKLLRNFYIATRNGDGQERAEVLKKMLDFNKRHPTAAITPDTIDNSMAQHMKTSSEMYHGITINKSLRPELMRNIREYDDEDEE